MNGYWGVFGMTLSKTMADRAALDIRRIIMAMIQMIYYLDPAKGQDANSEAKRRMELIKKDIIDLNKRYMMSTSLHAYYDVIIEPNTLLQLMDLIEKNHLDEAFRSLQSYDESLREAIGQRKNPIAISG